ncbi:MAG: ABC-2 transporter permease [Oscillospiraceae bacterium]|nr:ABC-2 transporter permease [Oscillospiraceae bacterium]
MKGLLLKDWYMIKKYCRAYLVIAAILIAVSVVAETNLFLLFYPCMLCGVIPVNLLSYDERSNWLRYSCTMPYTKKQIVSAKYLIGILSQLALIALTGIAQGIKMTLNGSFEFKDFAVFISVMLALATLSSSIPLPFVFKMGVEKGRIAYYVMIGVLCAASFFAANVIRGEKQAEFGVNTVFAALGIVGVGIYFLSWRLSVKLFSKREM